MKRYAPAFLSLCVLTAGCETYTSGISPESLADLENGRLDRYLLRAQDIGYHKLSKNQLILLCESLLLSAQFSQAERCLNYSSDQGFLDEAQYKGKLSLIRLEQGELERAIDGTSGINTRGAKYVRALAGIKAERQASVKNGPHSVEALSLASAWKSDPHPRWAFAAANLFMALDKPQLALDTLFDSETQLLPRFGIGKMSKPEALRVDLFGEFRFGLTELSEVAPASNMALQLLYILAMESVGNVDGARQNLQTFINHPSARAYPALLWQALYARGRLSLEYGRKNEAFIDFKEAIEIVEVARSNIATETGRFGFVLDKQELYQKMVALSVELGRYYTAFEYSERNRSRTLVDMIYSNRDLFSRSENEYQANAALNEYLASDFAFEASLVSFDTDTIKNAMDRLKLSKDKLKSTTPQLAQLVTVQTPDVKELQKSIAAGESVLSYFPYKKGYLAFIVTRDAISVVELDRLNLTDDVNLLDIKLKFITPQNYQRMPQAVDRVRDEIDVLLERLYDGLIAPIEEQITGRKLTIIPVDGLFYTPFAALRNDNRYLIEDYNIRYLPSLSVLSTPATQPTSEQKSLIFANPTFQDSRLEALPETKNEALEIGALLPKAEIFMEKLATETRFYAFAPESRHIHIASHAIFDDTEPLNSAILLSADNQNDGHLTVRDLYRQKLRAKTVVLSACDTVRADIHGGGEMIGLIRGFFYAGVDDYVGSLWAVPDESTAILMRQYYRELALTDSSSLALARAQRFLIETYDREPYFWAAFSTYGRT